MNKSNLQQWKRVFGRAVISAIAAVVMVHLARAAESTNAPVQIKSVFEAPTKPGYTDPFFPRTQRLAVNKRTEAAPAASAPAPSTTVINQLVVRSIILGKEKTAQINNRILAEGESGTVSLAKGSAQLQVLEIRPRSIVIKIDNDPEPKEIYLRPF